MAQLAVVRDASPCALERAFRGQPDLGTEALEQPIHSTTQFSLNRLLVFNGRDCDWLRQWVDEIIALEQWHRADADADIMYSLGEGYFAAITRTRDALARRAPGAVDAAPRVALFLCLMYVICNHERCWAKRQLFHPADAAFIQAITASYGATLAVGKGGDMTHWLQCQLQAYNHKDAFAIAAHAPHATCV